MTRPTDWRLRGRSRTVEPHLFHAARRAEVELRRCLTWRIQVSGRRSDLFVGRLSLVDPFEDQVNHGLRLVVKRGPGECASHQAHFGPALPGRCVGYEFVQERFDRFQRLRGRSVVAPRECDQAQHRQPAPLAGCTVIVPLELDPFDASGKLVELAQRPGGVYERNGRRAKLAAGLQPRLAAN